MKSKRMMALVLSAVFLIACGATTLITTFKVGFASSRPFVQSLVTSGSITQAQADAAIADIGDGLNAADRGNLCIKAVISTGGAKKVAQGKCYFALAQELRLILDRHHLTGNPRLDQISTIVQGAIEAFEAYYAAVTPPDSEPKRTASAPKPVDPDPDKTLETKLKDLKRQFDDLQ